MTSLFHAISVTLKRSFDVKHFKIRHSHLLRKYVTYNLCFVMIPVIILAAIYYVNAKKQVIQEYELTHQYALAQTMDSIDRRLNEFSVIAGQMASDTLLTPFEMRNSYYGKIAGIERLRTYFARTDFLENIMLYYYNDDQLYGSGGTSSLATFYDVSYEFVGPWDISGFSALLNSRERLGSSPYQCYLRRKSSETGSNLIVITSPCPPSAVSSFGTIVGLANQNFFQSLLDAMASDLTSASFMLDSERRILFTTEENLNMTQTDIEKLVPADSALDTSEVDIDGKKYSLIVMKSKLIGWYYVTVFPHDQFAYRFIKAQTPLILIMIFLCFAGIAMAIVLAFKNYKPIQKLGEILNANQYSERKGNELMNINRAVQEMVSSNMNLRMQLDDNRVMVVQSHLMNLLSGHTEDNQRVAMKNLEQEGIHLPGSFYCVMVLRLPVKISAEYREEVINELNDSEQINAYALDIHYRNLIAVVFSLEHTAHERDQMAHDLSDIIKAKFDVKPQLGVGQAYCNLNQINRSYVEAITAIETIVNDTHQSIVYFDALQTEKFAGSFWYPSKAQMRLIQALRQGNSKSLSESIEEMRLSIKKLSLPPHSIRLRFMTSSIVVQLMPLIEDLKLDDSDQDINSLIHYGDIDDFMQKLELFCRKMLHSLEDNKKKEREDLFSKIIAYINSHYMDQGISLNSISDRFDITPSYLSRFFRDNASVNFIDYLTDKRMTHACNLLVETDMKIREIMEQVGYIDLASFTRKFTQVFGISPGRYRDEKRH